MTNTITQKKIIHLKHFFNHTNIFYMKYLIFITNLWDDSEKCFNIFQNYKIPQLIFWKIFKHSMKKIRNLRNLARGKLKENSISHAKLWIIVPSMFRIYKMYFDNGKSCLCSCEKQWTKYLISQLSLKPQFIHCIHCLNS